MSILFMYTSWLCEKEWKTMDIYFAAVHLHVNAHTVAAQQNEWMVLSL